MNYKADEELLHILSSATLVPVVRTSFFFQFFFKSIVHKIEINWIKKRHEKSITHKV